MFNNDADESHSSLQVENQVPLASLHTFASEAVAREVVTIDSFDALTSLLCFLKNAPRPHRVLGSGSNVVFVSDFSGTLIRNRLKGRKQIEETDRTVTWRVAGGESWHDWVCFSSLQGWGGLENLALIPGTVGAAPIQNIGAYGVELSSVCVGLNAIDLVTGQQRYFSNEACCFSYRDSFFKMPESQGRWLILSVDFQLSKYFTPQLDYPGLEQTLTDASSHQLSPAQVCEAVCQLRKSKLPDPQRYPNAGSFFKNPLIPVEHFQQLQQSWPKLPGFVMERSRKKSECAVQWIKVPAAYLIEQVGLKGFSMGDVGVSPQHALVLVRLAPGSGASVVALVKKIQEKVYSTFKIALVPEPQIW